MNPDPYFLRSEVSNSDLTSLKNELYGRDDCDPTSAYAFGTLVDAMITEQERIHFLNKTIDGLTMQQFGLSYADFDKAKAMMKAFRNDSFCKMAVHSASYQKVSTSERTFSHMGIEFTMPVRCKWDFFGHMSGDIKSTMATTQKQFEAACHYFDYFRSRAWYMDIENTNRDVLIGISKVNYKIFVIPIIRGSTYYELGKQQYTELAFKYWALKYTSVGT